jgi:hypothetical protein
MPLKIGNFVKVLFEGALAPQPVAGRVVRICVASMASSGVRYNIGIAFKAPIDLDLSSQSRGDSKPVLVAAADTQEPSELVNRGKPAGKSGACGTRQRVGPSAQLTHCRQRPGNATIVFKRRAKRAGPRQDVPQCTEPPPRESALEPANEREPTSA